jgi:flagellar assembly protein FliH
VSVEPFAWESIARPWAASGGPGGRTAPPDDPLREQLARAAIEQDAFARGYAEGERAGRESESARASGLVQRLTEAFGELHERRADMLRQAERQTVQLAVAIAERIVQREVSIDPRLLTAMGHAALERLGNRGTATIRLHPDDHRAIETSGPLTEQAHVRVAADSSVERGGCVVDSELGLLDASPGAQLRELVHALFEDAAASDAAAVTES